MRVGKTLFRACKSSAVFLASAAAFFFIPDEDDGSDVPDLSDTGNPHGSNDYFGEFNFRTGKFDLGTDPTGWYEDER